MSGPQIVVVGAGDDGLRLDRWFRLYFPTLRHGQLQKLLRTGQVRLDGARVGADARITTGAKIRVPPLGFLDAEADADKRDTGPARLSDRDVALIRSLVFYEDADIIALNKPFGLAVQGGEKTLRHIDGMLDALIVGGGERPRLVHRLDRDTGGILILGRTRQSTTRLAEAFRRHEIRKTYWALTAGAPNPPEGRIELAMEKSTSGGGRERMGVTAAGKRARTDYQTVEATGTKAAFLALRPETGRTHQLRVHLAAIGTPIIGDGKYGGALSRLEGVSAKLHLFCRQMQIPRQGRPPLDLKAPLTGHMAETWAFFHFPQPDRLSWPDA